MANHAIAPSEQFMLRAWLRWVLQLEELGFTRNQAHNLAALKQKYYASEDGLR